jgi:hypothetical protein
MHDHNNDLAQSGSTFGGLRGWMMICITLIFVSLYAAALFGWLRPLSDVTMITRLEPIIFVIAGYYFGRLPGQSVERALKEEIIRQSKKTDAMQHAKELAEKERDTIEEKAKNASLALGVTRRGLNESSHSRGDRTNPQTANGTCNESVQIAAKILDS